MGTRSLSAITFTEFDFHCHRRIMASISTVWLVFSGGCTADTVVPNNSDALRQYPPRLASSCRGPREVTIVRIRTRVAIRNFCRKFSRQCHSHLVLQRYGAEEQHIVQQTSEKWWTISCDCDLVVFIYWIYLCMCVCVCKKYMPQENEFRRSITVLLRSIGSASRVLTCWAESTDSCSGSSSIILHRHSLQQIPGA